MAKPIYIKKAKFKVKNMIKYPQFPKAIEIQTTTACNAKCIICPHVSVTKDLAKGIMSIELFSKILDEIGDNKTLIVPYLNGEPFLDPLFFSRLDLIKERCPEAMIEISTNLSILNKDKINQLSHHKIDELRLSIFGFRKKTYQKIMPGLNYQKVMNNLKELLGDKKIRSNIKKISLVMISFPGISNEEIEEMKKFCQQNYIRFNLWGFLDRAGNVKYFKNRTKKGIVIGCIQERPLERMHIDFEGNVILCCQDWKKEIILGNLAENTILEVWHNKKYQKIREAIYNAGLNTPHLCEKCKLAKIL